MTSTDIPTRAKKRKLNDADNDDRSPPVDDAEQKRARRAIPELEVWGAENEFAALPTGSNIRLEDLLAPLASQSSSLQSLQNVNTILSGASAKAQTLPVPLPHSTQERLDREEAYEHTKQEVSKWGPTVKRISNAEHLNFPLQVKPEGKVSNLELTAKFKPTTKLENSIDKLLNSALLREDSIHRTEELKMNRLSPEEVAARRKELRQMRDLMFRKERKAKRIAKIKSKVYRRIRRKRTEKADVDDGEEATSDVLDVENVEHVDAVQKEESLRRKIQGQESDEEDDDTEDANLQADGEMNDQGSDKESSLQSDDEALANRPTVQRIGGRVVFTGAPSKTSRETQPPITPSLPTSAAEVTTQTTETRAPSLSKKTVASPSRPPAPEVNPWLAKREEALKIVPQKNSISVAKESKMSEKARHKLKKKTITREGEKGKLKDDATLEISTTDVLALDAVASATASSNKPRKSASPNDNLSDQAGEDKDGSDAISDVEEQLQGLTSEGPPDSQRIRAFQQRDLVALAFAGDNVVQAFQETKRLETEEDAPREIDTTLPGWGSWGGARTREPVSKPHLIKKIPGIDQASRADFNKPHIIISEKRDKKAAKYLVKDLPYPYTSKAQFERSMDTPLGPEWNTRISFQRGILPKVVKKMGSVIDPLQKLF